MATERIQRRIDFLLDEADAAVAESDWATVRDRVQNVLRLDPGNPDALSNLAAAERDVEDPQSNLASHDPVPIPGPTADQ